MNKHDTMIYNTLYPEKEKAWLKWVTIAGILFVILMGFLAFSARKCLAYSDEEIVNAIFIIEGGYKAQYLYGIRSVSYKDEAEARRICFNTVRNNRKRFADYGHKKYNTYLEFLASRYCPIGAKNDKKGLNKYWLRNLRYYLEDKVKNGK